MDIFSLKIGDLIQKLYIRSDAFISGVLEGGASDYHDQFGHVVSALFLTNWPKKYSHLSSPVVFSTQTLIAEQIAELFQRMMIRCSPKDINEHRILYYGTLGKKVVIEIQNEICAKLSGHTCTINFPDPNGTKLSKNEALSWTCLFAIEDLHVLAKDIIGQRAKQQKKFSVDSYQVITNLVNCAEFNHFKQKVAKLMYYMAVNPDALAETKEHRNYIMKNCLSMMGLEPNDPEMNARFGQYLSDAALSCFYETFIQKIGALDTRGISDFDKPFSAMTIEELNALPVEYFLPQEDIPFDLLIESEPPPKNDYWIGVARYETTRDLYLIEQILPPSSQSLS